MPIFSSKSGVKSVRKKTKSGEPINKYNYRFVPVDSIKHLPSISTASLETAAVACQDYSLEFCAREKSLPYARMIHRRMLLATIDHNIQQIDSKAVFLLAEATIWILKNIIEKLVSRSKLKEKIRRDYLFEKYKNLGLLSKKYVQDYYKNANTFLIDEQIYQKMTSTFDNEKEEFERMELDENLETNDSELNTITDDLNSLNPKKLPINLFDLKNLLQVSFKNYFRQHIYFKIQIN